MKAIDTDGVKLWKKQALQRRKYFTREPNWAWHVDGYDKLKPYSFPVYGCILWLSIVPFNNNSNIVGKLSLDYVKSIGGCSKKVVGDQRGIFEEMVSMNWPERTVFCMVNLCQISE